MLCSLVTAPTSSIQLVACNVAVQTLIRSIQVVTESFPYIQIDSTNYSVNNAEHWSEWALPDTPTNPTLFNVSILLPYALCRSD